MPRNVSDIDKIELIHSFLQGGIPEGYKIKKDRVPNLTPDQAWTVIWFIQTEGYMPERIERCDVCGEIYDSDSEGGCEEDGPPYLFCDSCWQDMKDSTDE